MICANCSKEAIIEIHGHQLCLHCYEKYYYEQEEAVLDFEFITEKKDKKTIMDWF
jgi:hypothetical protein